MSAEPQKSVMSQFGEPWEWSYWKVSGDSEVTDNKKATVFMFEEDGGVRPSPEELARIVACVNACAGVPTEWLTYGCVRELRESDGLRNI